MLLASFDVWKKTTARRFFFLPIFFFTESCGKWGAGRARQTDSQPYPNPVMEIFFNFFFRRVDGDFHAGKCMHASSKIIIFRSFVPYLACYYSDVLKSGRSSHELCTTSNPALRFCDLLKFCSFSVSYRSQPRRDDPEVKSALTNDNKARR